MGKLKIYLYSLLMGLMCVSSVYAGAVHSKVKLAKASDVTVLYTQTAASATIHKSGAKMLLTLKSINPHTLWFLDRPGRHAGTIDNVSFVKAWNRDTNNSFAKVNPNANIVSVVDDHGVHTVLSGVFTLANPVYDAKTQSLTYDIVKTLQPLNLKKHHKFSQVALFIDGDGFPW